MTRLIFHLVHIMNESNSCDGYPGQLLPGVDSAKKVK